jgi:hypothetical protein
MDSISADRMSLSLVSQYKLTKKMRNKTWYDNNKNYHKNYYNDNKDLIKARNKFNYYKRTDNIEKFINKYPKEYELILENNI